jgi:membrane-associated protein
MISTCGILGNMLGYWFGNKSGPYLFKKKDSFIFKQKYLLQAKDFYDQYGPQAIVIARFLPTIRTFAPIIAGVVGMNKIKFQAFNVMGCLLWVIVMTTMGHYLDKIFIDQFGLDIKNHLEVIVISLIIVTSIPFVWKYLKAKRKNRNKA